MIRKASILANSGQLEDALEMIEAIKDTTAQEAALQKLAIDLAERGNVKDALIIANNVLKSPETQLHTLKNIALATANQGNIKEAIIIIDTIKDFSIKSSALSELTAIMVRIGNIRDALIVANAIKDLKTQSCALRNISQAIANQGNVEEAIGTINTIGDNNIRSCAFRDISDLITEKAFDLVKIGQLANAIKMISSIIDLSIRSYVLLKLVHKLVEIGNIKDVLIIANTPIDLKEGWSHALHKFAQALLDGGNIEEAIGLIDMIKDESVRWAAFKASLDRIIEKMQPEEALRHISRIKGTWYGNAIEILIKKSFIEIESFGDALVLINKCGDTATRLHCLEHLAVMLIMAGKLDDATNYINEHIADQIVWDDSDESREIIYKYLAALINSRNLNEIPAVINSIKSVRLRQWLFDLLPGELLKFGRLNDALTVINGIENELVREIAYRRIVDQLIKEKRFNDVEIVINQLTVSSRKDFLIEICHSLRFFHRDKEAMKWASKMLSALK
jgi:tetratricopeptide (TPR) repeat protein